MQTYSIDIIEALGGLKVETFNWKKFGRKTFITTNFPVYAQPYNGAHLLNLVYVKAEPNTKPIPIMKEELESTLISAMNVGSNGTIHAKLGHRDWTIEGAFNKAWAKKTITHKDLSAEGYSILQGSERERVMTPNSTEKRLTTAFEESIDNVLIEPYAPLIWHLDTCDYEMLEATE